MKKDRNVILAVGAHPDDIEIGCGGTLAKHIERGDDVYVIVMTNGERGNHNMDRSECLRSLQTLGVKGVFFGNFPAILDEVKATRSKTSESRGADIPGWF